MNFNRLFLYIQDEARYGLFMRLLGLCQSNADVCLAMRCLCDKGGKIDQCFTSHGFVESILPCLNFKTTENALYLAIYKRL